MPLLIALAILVVVGYWFNSGGAQAWFQNTGFYKTPLELLSRPIFSLLMSKVAGLVFLLLIGFVYQKYPENEFWVLMAAWTIGWWLGYFFYSRISDDQRQWLRRKLGGRGRR